MADPDTCLARARKDRAVTSRFLGGILLGIALGIVLTLAAAPRTGDVRARAVRLVTRAGQGTGRHSIHDAAIEREIGGDQDPRGAA